MKIIMSRIDRASPEPEKGQALQETVSDPLTSASAYSHSTCSFFSWKQVSERDRAEQLTPNEVIYQAAQQKTGSL